jgi:hypothetical protein
MRSADRLYSALASFVRQRSSGTQSKRHITPLVQFLAAELVSRGFPAAAINRNVRVGTYYSTTVKLLAKGERVTTVIVVVTQSGAIRKNLTNRCRELVGDAVNLRAADANARIGVVYVLRADEEARRPGADGRTAIEELASFMESVQQPSSLLEKPLFDACALIAADQGRDGRVHIAPVGRMVDIQGGFFERVIAPA